MLVKEFYKLVRKGYNPIIKINERFEYLVEQSGDTEMICQVINASPNDVCEDNRFVKFEFDFGKFEEHNKIVARSDWKDSNGNPVLKWMESKCYPKNGIDTIYLPTDEEIPFEIINNNSLFYEYLKEKSTLLYVNWLEENLIKNRKYKTN